jgi:catechol 2,3-dioxygenase-like lactoylglutathione lyase family enzyme
MKMAIRGLHHVGISVPDLEAAVDFYVEAFGFRKILFESWKESDVADGVLGLEGSAAGGVNLWTGNGVLELFEFSAPPSAPQDLDHPVNDHGINHVCLQVSDIHQEVARLGTLGMRFHSAPVGDGSGWFTYGRDPWGNVIELVEPLSPEVPHIDGWQFRTLSDRSYD